MNLFVCRLALVILVAAVYAGCGKKTPVAENREPVKEGVKEAKEESPKVPAKRGMQLREGIPVAEPVNRGTDPAVAGVPVDLLAAGGAYEAWFARYGLDLRDPAMLDADADGDGASNRDEFTADTNPRDPNSRPGLHKEMRLKEYQEVRVPLILESVEGHVAKIKRVDKEESVSVSVGQTLDGMKVEKIVSRRETDKNGDPVDLSRVDLENPVTKAKVALVKDLPARSADTYAILSSKDGASVKVHAGETFVWPAENGGSYKVIDLRQDQAVIQELASGKMWTIPRN